MRILAVIPARGGSKGIPRKNITLLAGCPLISYTLAAAKAAEKLDRIIVSTEDNEIAKVCKELGTEVLLRPKELAQDNTPTLVVIQHVVEQLNSIGYFPDAVMTLQPTSPLRTARHIDEAIEYFMADSSADSLVSCVSVPHTFHPLSVMRLNKEGYLIPFYDGQSPVRRQDKEVVFARNGAAIYITRTNCISDYIFGGRLIPYHMDEQDSIDIDTLDDLIEVERILAIKSI
jgi:CMP-N-acetylneuraminic acid synthetase